MSAFLDKMSNIIFLMFVVGIPLYATIKKINVFDAFIDGAKNGFQTAINLIPYFVAMLVAIGMLRASGFFEILQSLLTPVLKKFNIPVDFIPLILIRPFSGSASNGILIDIIHQFGGDSWVSKTASTMVGCTETTFYVVAVYFGAVNIRHTRYAIPVGLLTDFLAVVVSFIVGRFLFFN